MPVVRAFYQDPFSPVLFNSPALLVTDEQRDYIKKVLAKSSSDSRFADKAYVAISLILTGGITKVPTVTSLTPASAEIGDPNPTLHVHGTNFTSTSKIIFNGGEEVTTYVSATELTTIVNMATVSGPAVVPVMVSNDGVLSSPMNFTFTDGTPSSLSVNQQKTLAGHKVEPSVSQPVHPSVKEKK
jgi:hypothetical protein